MYYFAYGSNIAPARILERISSAELVSRGYLLNHRLSFHKVGQDGSAKCDAFETGNIRDCVLGALYRIDPAEKEQLDQVEGLGNGYDEKEVTIMSDSGKRMTALTYYATNIDTTLKPFHWYKGHVLIGARENDFPDEYIEQYLSVESIDDPDIERAERELAIHGLGGKDRFGRVGE